MAQSNQDSFEVTASGGGFGALVGDAPVALALGAVKIDHARSTLPIQDPEGALEAWRAFLDGRCSLVALFDYGGRHFIVVRPTEPGVVSPSALTARERRLIAYRARGHAQKYIAYELGLTPSTISAVMASARAKLGLRSDVDLIATFSSNAAPQQALDGFDPELPVPAGLRKSTLLYQRAQLVVMSFVLRDFEVPECLSEAERYVLGCLLDGDPMAKIAERRGTSLHTVCNQIASIYRKIDVRSRAELVTKLCRSTVPRDSAKADAGRCRLSPGSAS